jgi:GNAT superfamily N-acetyltransferase
MPDTSLLIRPATPSDFDQLCKLWEVLDEHHRQLRPDLFRKPLGQRRDPTWVNGVIEAPDSDILVAEAPDGALVGLALLIVRTPPDLPVRVAPPYVEIDNIVVLPLQGRSGVGSQLVAGSKAWARARGYAELQLTVYAFNAAALPFYAREGFAPLSHRMVLGI